MTGVRETVDTAKHGRHRAQASAASNQEHDEDLIFDGLSGRHPAEICPVIMPGKETTPVAAIELITGISALRSAPRVTGAVAACLEAPSMSCASTPGRRLTRLVVSVLRPSPTPVMQLPKIMPSSGIA